jgi:hypothetical protein
MCHTIKKTLKNMVGSEETETISGIMKNKNEVKVTR